MTDIRSYSVFYCQTSVQGDDFVFIHYCRNRLDLSPLKFLFLKKHFKNILVFTKVIWVRFHLTSNSDILVLSHLNHSFVAHVVPLSLTVMTA